MKEYINAEELVASLSEKWHEIFDNIKKPYNEDAYYALGRERGISDAILAIRQAQGYNEFIDTKDKGKGR